VNVSSRSLKINITFEDKIKKHKEVTENSNASSKNLKSELKKKINYDVVDASPKNLRQSKKFDAIDVRVYTDYCNVT